MMITTKGAARFHSNGFVSPDHADEIMAAATAPNPNALNGTKRLASCREELERSWAGAQDMHCVSMNDGDYSEDDAGDSSRSKRRRTLQPTVSSDDMMAESSFVRGHRITPDNRPPRQLADAKAPVQAGWYPPQQREAPANPPVVKAGWYEGEVDAMGNRHGKGITKHDDGTEYEGQYVNDVMESGTYKFATTRQLVPHPHHSGAHLQRQIEKSFEGTFKNDMPQGAGMIVTRTVDWAAPPVAGAPFDIPFTETTYDIGMHRQTDGKAVGEGVRIIYAATNAEGRSTLEKTCFRLNNGENTGMHVADSYARWILQCMGMDFPVPSPTA